VSNRAQSLSVVDGGALDEERFVGHFTGVYEHSPWVAREAWRRRPSADFEALAGAFETAVREAPEDARLALVRAHPELGGHQARTGELTEESAAEQTAAGRDRLTAEQARRLHQLNRAYGERFGFPLVISVRGRDPDSILDEGEARLRNSPEQELNRAITQTTRIARLRLRDLVADSDGRETARPKPEGK
jgi:2-oxo-4-hydroxy-4-carboxy-5-ureidoimidazoline decarboxylase